MHSDDEQIGRVLSRREVLTLLGATGAGLFLAPGATATGRGVTRAMPACVVRPAQTAGPYFVDTMLNRSDIRSEPTTGQVSGGMPLDLRVAVSRVGQAGCVPLAGAMVDIWQCDAVGIYSGVVDMANRFDTTGQKFLRGHQVTGRNGVVDFTTIYPGWYEGRTVHIHFKIRVPGDGTTVHDFTSQLYFSDEQSDRVFAKPLYAANTQRRARNAQDSIFPRGGPELVLELEESGARLKGTFDIGLQIA